MNIDEFITANRCEHLYHISEKGSWPIMQQLGLLSTSSLLTECGISGEDRIKYESELRTKKMPIEHPIFGTIFLRDQDPMRSRPSNGIVLADLLYPGILEREWFEFLNGKTFFWVSESDFRNMLCARLYRNKLHWIIKIDTHSLLESYAEVTSITDQNSGSLYSRKLRGPTTFIPLLQSPPSRNIKELAVDNGIYDIQEHAITVDECTGVWENNETVCKFIRHIWP